LSDDKRNAVVVCRQEDIRDLEARGFEFGDPELRLTGFVVRKDGGVYAYRNVCPHAGHRLNWKPDAFLTRDRDLIMCSMHGAIFDIESGVCIGGPCPGRSLARLRVEIVSGEIVVYPD